MGKVNVGDRVEIRVGDERGGWGTVADVPATALDGRYHVRMYDSTSDIRVFDRSEIRRPNGQPATTKQRNRCLCGCQQLTGGRFRPGHDARYASLLVQEYREADLSWEQVKQAADRVSPKFAAKVLARVARTNVINARRPE